MARLDRVKLLVFGCSVFMILFGWSSIRNVIMQAPLNRVRKYSQEHINSEIPRDYTISPLSAAALELVGKYKMKSQRLKTWKPPLFKYKTIKASGVRNGWN